MTLRKTIAKLKELLAKSKASGWSYEPNGDPDGELVATAMTSLPRLLAYIERLERVATLVPVMQDLEDKEAEKESNK